MKYKLFVYIVIAFAACQNLKKEVPKDEIIKLLPQINVSQGKKINSFGNNECLIELRIGNFAKNIDSFFPTYFNRKELIYIDLAKNPSVSHGMIEFEDIKMELYPKKFGELLRMSFATTTEERLYIPINRYCLFVNDSTLTVTKDEVNSFSSSEKDTIKDFEVLFQKSLSSIINEIKNPTSEKNDDDKVDTKIVENQYKKFNEIQLTLTDATIKKAKIYLGEPDKFEYGFGHVTKGFAVYYNIVENQNGTPKHLILFLRMNGNQWGNNAKIEEIYCVDDNQKTCFGIHCIKIKDKKISTNALDLIIDSKYDGF